MTGHTPVILPPPSPPWGTSMFRAATGARLLNFDPGSWSHGTNLVLAKGPGAGSTKQVLTGEKREQSSVWGVIVSRESCVPVCFMVKSQPHDSSRHLHPQCQNSLKLHTLYCFWGQPSDKPIRNITIFPECTFTQWFWKSRPMTHCYCSHPLKYRQMQLLTLIQYGMSWHTNQSNPVWNYVNICTQDVVILGQWSFTFSEPMQH